ncbi:CBM96 family carbohydrate-binding protein [Myxococcus faecalis]|uniref:CBM96 family carbohydrate-binding protein n=1 Tax=Myxococcus faecalis TaxID=3115646 RepID=UPI003CE6AA0F
MEASPDTRPESSDEELVTRTVTFGAGADTHVVATSPTTSFGSSPTLEVDRAPESEAYLRFYIEPFTGTVTTARLRVFAVDGSVDGPTVYDPPGVRSWNELTTWSNRPDWGGYWGVVSAGAVASGTWMELDVSDMSISQGSYVDVFLRADSTDGMTLASSEHPDPALRPQLVLTLESASDHPPPRPVPLTVSGAPVSFAPSADTFVSEDAPGSSEGGSARALRVGTSPGREAHLRFSVTGLTETVQRAVLRLRVAADGTEGGPSVFGTQGTWSESGLTWRTRPARVGGTLDRAPFLAPYGFVEYDVTNQVRGNGDVTFGLYGNSGDEVTFHSREAADLEPRLFVWAGASRSEPGDDCMTRQEVIATTVPPLHDTYATPEAPSTTYHREASLRVDGAPRAEGFLDFDVQLGTQPVRRVLLRLYALDASANGPQVFSAQSFDEATTDWAHRPVVSGSALANLGAVTRDSWVEIDVTDVVTTSGRHAFALVPDSADGLRFASSEASERGILDAAPQLVVVKDTAPRCSYRGTKPSGTTAWVKQSTAAEAERSHHTAPAPGGGFVVLGHQEQTRDAPPSAERTDVVTLHRADGSVVWTRAFTQAQVSFSKVAVTARGHVLAAGSYAGTPDLGAGALPQGTGMFVLELTASGAVAWARGYTAWFQRADERLDNPMQVLDLATDAQGGAVLVGTFWGYTDFGAGPVYSGKPFPYDDTYPNSYVLKLDGQGGYQWAKLLLADTLRGTQATSVAVDAGGQVTVGGWAGRATDFGAGPDARSGPFVARWAASGALGWVRVIPVYFSSLRALAVMPDGGVAFIGDFGGRFDFAGQSYASREPDEYDGGPRDTMLGRLGATGADVVLRTFRELTFQDLIVDAQGHLVTTQAGGGSLLGLGDVGPSESEAPYRPTVASFTDALETRWVRVFDLLQSNLLLTPQPGGILFTGDLVSAFEVDGVWYTPTSRRSDVLHLLLRP